MMKGIIVLAVAIGLVSMQGTSIIEDVMSNDLERTDDYDDTNVDGRDAILTGLIGNKLRNILSRPVRCSGNSCIMCLAKNCLKATYDKRSKHIYVIGSYDGKDLLNTTIPARHWMHCQKFETMLGETEGCLTLSNLKIVGGTLCADVKIEAGILVEKKFHPVCL